MQSRIMSHKDADGESQDGHDGNADANGVAEEEDKDQSGSDPESFFQCVDTVEPHGPARAVDVNDADTEFPSGEDEDGDAHGDDDVCVSFATAVGDRLHEEQAELDEEEEEEGEREEEEEEEEEEDMSRYDYGMWLADEPVPIKERRRRLLQGMGLTSSRALLRSRNARGARCASRRPAQQPASAGAGAGAASASTAAASDPEAARRHPWKASLTRCRSDSSLAVRGGTARKPPPSFRRVLSVPHSLHGSPLHRALRSAARCPSPSAASKFGGVGNGAGRGDLAMRNLDGGKEFAVTGRGEATTGVQLSVDKLEKFIGYTPLVKQLMRRSQSQPVPAAGAAKDGEKPGKRKTRWLKNIKLVASATAGLIHEKDRSSTPPSSAAAAMSVVIKLVPIL